MGRPLPEHRLSRTHLLALCLAALGAGDGLIAECLGVEPEAVGPLLEVARAKAANAGFSQLTQGLPIDLSEPSESATAASNAPEGEPQP